LIMICIGISLLIFKNWFKSLMHSFCMKTYVYPQCQFGITIFYTIALLLTKFILAIGYW
jgi:hypothetical protein